MNSDYNRWKRREEGREREREREREGGREGDSHKNYFNFILLKENRDLGFHLRVVQVAMETPSTISACIS
jgi:hypothetical protein